MKSNSKKPLPVIEDHYDDLIPEFPQVSKVKCIGCLTLIDPCLLAYKSGRWTDPSNESLKEPIKPDYQKPPKLLIWINLCLQCGKNEKIRRDNLESVKMKLPFFVDLIELPLPQGVRYKKRKKLWKPKRDLEAEANSSGVTMGKKLTALDILDKSRLPSPKDLRYM